MEGYQSRSFDCEVGSHFHHGYVSGGPPIIPDSRISQVRFETLAFPPCSYPTSERLKRWFAYTPSSVVCPQSRSATCVGLTPALRPATALTMEPPSVQSPFAQGRCYLPWGDVARLLRGHYSPFFAHTDSCANPAGSPLLRFFTSFRESLQVATSPCRQRHLPDSISANLSPDAWSPTPTVPPSACTCFFPGVIGLPQDTMGRLSRFVPRTRLSAG